MIQVTRTIAIDERELDERFVRASGPGGQNVNKVATAVQLRFDVGCSGLPPDVQQRLLKLAGKKVTQEGVLLLTGRRFRTQERNREDVMDRLVDLVRRAAVPARKRKRTSPTLASVRKRIENKRRTSEKKRERGPVHE